MTGRLAGRVAIVTGAGSGIGRAIALRFAAEGAEVVVADVTGREAELAAEIGRGALAVRADVADERQVSGLVEASVAHYGRLDIVSNNAGLGGDIVALHETPLEMVDALLRVNLRGAMIVLQRSIAQMLCNGGGAIVNTASIAGYQATPGHGAYSATKGGVLAMTRAAAIEYGGRGIRVNAVCPGPVETEMVAKAPAELRERLVRRIPMGRFGTPDEIARIVLFLASEDAAYVTGVGLVADGGRLASAI